MERYNDKWESKTPEDKRLTDEEVEHFIKSLLPVVFHILYNPFEEVSILCDKNMGRNFDDYDLAQNKLYVHTILHTTVMIWFFFRKLLRSPEQVR